ncbi:MAG: hypothetical protein U1G08_16185 [Verrucomicrobiota bacterium]
MNLFKNCSWLAFLLSGASILSAQTDDLDFGSKTDLWDVSQGTVITKISGQADLSFRPENAFGGTFPNADGRHSFTFEDGRPAGYVHFIEWKTAAPVGVASFELRSQGDGPIYLNGREFDKFRLFAKSIGSTNFDILLYEYTPTHPFSFTDFSTRLVLAAQFPPVVAQEFRAEFVDTGVRYWSAPRIWELDGFGPPYDFGSKGDLWDLSQGTTITGISGQADATFRPENMFGGLFPNADGMTTFTFEDGHSAGYVHFIEWATKEPVRVRSIYLRAQGDGPTFLNGREFDRFRLLAKSQGSQTFDTVLYDFSPSHPYTFEDFDTRLILSSTVAGPIAREYRAEFVDTGVRFWSAPRIWELDGFADPITHPIQAVPAIELVWQTVAGKRLQVEWREDLAGSSWKPYGDPFVGSGAEGTILVSTRDKGTRLFRLVQLP